jgi:hypothetical protein
VPDKPPEFTLARLDALLAEKCAEDVAALARRQSVPSLAACDPRLSEVADGLMRDVAVYWLAGRRLGYPLPGSGPEIAGTAAVPHRSG